MLNVEKKCGHLFYISLKRIYFAFQKGKKKRKKKAQWSSFVQAFSYQDINSSSSNFIFLPKLEIK